MLEVDIRRKLLGDGDEERVQIMDVRLKISRGKVLALLGPSGAGKTTLIKIVSGIDRQFEGAVAVAGVPVAKPSRAIQTVFQDFVIVPWLTTKGNIDFVSRDACQRRRGYALLSEFGLASRMNAWPRTLSGGEKTRLALARALVEPPKVLLLDEPFRNLDVVTKWALIKRITREIKDRGISALIVSHSIADAIMMGDRVVVLTNRPMTIAEEVVVNLPFPRHPGSDEVNEVVARVTGILENDRRISPAIPMEGRA